KTLRYGMAFQKILRTLALNQLTSDPFISMERRQDTTTVPCVLLAPNFSEFWPRSSAKWLQKREESFYLRNIVSQQEGIQSR
ncbi:hypothetical protein MRX96_053976, partial [Rhipicephalus microplus]